MSQLLDAATTQLLIIDVQERLLPAMSQPDETLANVTRLLQAARRLGPPITVSEQYPKGIGPTVEPLRELLPNEAAVLQKMSFSCMRHAPLAARIRDLAAQGRRRILLCGIEAHVCVLQTAIDIVEAGYEACVTVDAVSSRAPASRDVALRRMERAGVGLLTTEMAIFEWLGEAGTADFKALMPLIK